MSMLGKHHSEETIRKIKATQTGHKRGEEFKAKMRELSKGNKNHLGHRLTPEQKARISEGTRRAMQDPAVREKIRQVQLGRKQTIERIQNRMEKSAPKWHMKPNMAEIKLGKYLDEVLPREYEFVGDGTIIIGGLCPDYINVNGKKKVILMHGDYWHKGEDTKHVVGRYAKFGFDCLVVWERELKKKEKLQAKLVAFNSTY